MTSGRHEQPRKDQQWQPVAVAVDVAVAVVGVADVVVAVVVDVAADVAVAVVGAADVAVTVAVACCCCCGFAVCISALLSSALTPLHC